MRKKTVFVIGAGTSAEANLPTGDGLKNKIAELLDTPRCDDIIVGALQEHVFRIFINIDIRPYLFEAWNIKEGMTLAISIDNYLDAHRDNDKIALCGKLAIVRSILDAEKSSLLELNDSDMDFKSLEKTWYLSFFKLLTENCASNQLKERFKSITLIIFNYDRCIEHFLYYALQTYYPELSPDKNTEVLDKIAELVKSINIYHPYGDVGSLPWMIRDETTMAFGKKPNTKELLELSKRIKTFTEGTDPESSEIVEIRQHMSSADRVVFLGFAFHKQNMELIAPSSNQKNKKVDFFATTYRESDSNKEKIKYQMKNLYKGKIYPTSRVNMENLKCAKFFKEYWKSLSF